MSSTRRWSTLRGAVIFSLIPVLADNVPSPAQQFPLDVIPTWETSGDSSTYAVALGDIDRDGDLDVVFGNRASANTLYRNDDGELTEVPVWSSQSQYATFATALGDVDGDGDLDLVCGNDGESNTFYRHEGGSFEATPTWYSGLANSTRAVLLGDIDGDGDLDLVCANGLVGQENTLYRNEGGTFSTMPSWTSGPANPTFAAALGDIDGDGDLDLACGNFGEKNTVYRNEGGQFEPNPAWSSGPANYTDALVLGDVDGDGDLDLACGNWGNQSNTLYLNEGGTFATTPAWSSIPRQTTLSVALGDVDGDGDLDLACGNDGNGNNTLYVNEGGALSEDPVWSAVTTRQTVAMALGDTDGDGDLDLVCGNNATQNTLYVNRGGPFSAVPDWSSADIRRTEAVRLGDIDDDGDLDLVCGNYLQGNTLYSNEAGSFAMTPVWTSTPASATYAIALGDVDGDGGLDLVTGNYRQGNALYLREEGAFATTPVWTSDATGATYAVALGDVDGDDDLDLACGNFGQNNTLYLNGGGTFSAAPDWSSEPASATRAVALGDVDGDGDLDLACGNFGQSNTLYLNDGGIFSTTPAWFSFTANQTAAVAFGDVDGDGDLDLACGNTDQQNAVYFNDGNTFAATPGWLSAYGSHTVASTFRDVDGDGDLDLVCANPGESTTIYINEAGALSRTEVWSFASGETRGQALGDLDGDGDLDLVCGNRDGADTVHRGLKGPVYKGDPTDPTNQLPNNGAHLRGVSIASVEGEPNLRTVELTVVDVESDRVWIAPQFQYEGALEWNQAEIGGIPGTIGPLESSPAGVVHQLPWDIFRLPIDDRAMTLRLRAISHPSRAGMIQHVASFNLEVGTTIPERAAIRPSSAALAFDTVTIGDTVSVTLALSNDGNDTLRIHDAALRFSRRFPFDIAPGATDSLIVFLEPVTAKGFPGDLRIASNDPTTPVLSIPLTTDVRDIRVETIALTVGTEAPLGEALIVQVVPDEFVRVERGALFHRPATGGDFESVELVPVGGALVGVVPGASVLEVGLEYWVEVENSGIVRTDPGTAPDSVFFQAVSAPASIAATIQANSGNDVVVNLDASVQVLLDDGIEFVEGTLHYREGGSDTFETTGFEANGRLLGATIPARVVGPRGVEFWAEVRTATAVLRDPPSDPAEHPHAISTVVPSLSEGAEHEALRYRMVSVPLTFEDFEVTLEDLLSDDAAFGPYDPVRWRAFRYSEGACHELVGGTYTVEHAVRAGRGFWLIARDRSRFDTGPVAGKSTPTGTPFPVPLTAGWNQFASPFAFPVPWDAVPSGTVDPPQSWNPGTGQYSDADVLRPFEGYFVESSEPGTLWIPPVEATGGASARSEPAPPDWRLRLTAVGPTASGTVSLGTHPEALPTFDGHDRRKPPEPPGSWLSLAIANRDWRERPGIYRRDFRDRHADGHAWNLEVLTDEKGEDVLLGGRWDPPPSAGIALSLVDLEQSARVDVTPGGEFEGYRLVSFGPERPYRLAVLAGSPEYVEQRGATLVEVPISLSLDRNAPNPFRHATRIRFGLPEPTSVRFTIFDLEGRRVARLVDREARSPGFHTVVWDGRDGSGRRVASGVYFYRLETDAAVVSRKMLVLR